MGKEYCKVLIVEDEFIMRQGMKHMLEWEKEGFTIVGEATNGQEALEKIEELKPNIIISDIVMPILDGVDFSKVVQKKYPDIQIIILSSYDNFDYVKNTFLHGVIDYILKPTLNPSQLINTLKKAVKKIPGFELAQNENIDCNNLIERYLLGFDSKINESKIFEFFPDTCFRILGINLKHICGRDKELRKKITSEFEEFLSENKKYKYSKILINDDELLYIINYKISNNSNIVEELEQFIKLNLLIQENIFFVITPMFNNIRDIKSIYNKKLKEYLLQKFYYKDSILLNTDTIEERFDYEKFDYELYLNSIKHKEFNEAIDMIKNYSEYAINMKMDEYKLKNLIKNLLYNIIIPLEEYRIEADELRQAYFKKIDNTIYFSNLIDVINSIISDLKEIISQNVINEEDVIKDILEYINKNYKEPLDLGYISKIFNFNYYYLSSYFNNYCKEGFSEYLNRIRVEKACNLLMKKNLYVSEVSSMVGYSDHSYFCRVFKKIKGYTPSSYRRVKLLEDEINA